MNTVLLKVLAVVLSGVSCEPLEEKFVQFNAMSVEYAAVYDADIRQFRQATATKVKYSKPIRQDPQESIVKILK